MIGKKFGRWTVLSGPECINKNYYWECLCACGTRSKVNGGSLRSGGTKSCGCINIEFCKENFKTHGKTGTQEHRSWKHLKERCLNPKCKKYHSHGGRGIKVCDRWKSSFKHFLEDMGERPVGKTSIDRIDNDGNYSCGHCEECLENGWPANCRWADAKEQGNNTRTCRYVEYNGFRGTLTQVCEYFGKDVNLVGIRLNKLGWSLEKSLETPVMTPKEAFALGLKKRWSAKT